jgi:hypothetical protein
MRNLFLLIVLVFSWPNLRAQSMPDLKAVVKAFFEQEPVDEGMFYALGFEHRPDGYYVVYKQDGINITDRVLFYDATRPSIDYADVGLFRAQFGVNYAPRQTDSDGLVAAYLRYLGKSTTDAFARQPYYGYEGWYKDVIAWFEAMTVLDDDELHALARAQSVAASSVLNNNRGHSLERERFVLPMGQNALTDTQVITYRELADKCLASYRKLKERSPDYLTPVGKAAIKYANEVMDVFLTLLYYQNPATAMDVLEENLYPAHLLRNARNLLNSCPPNAILITYGDNDTYPLYYLQAMRSMRKDVLIANSSLLILSRYRRMLQNEPLWTAPLRTRLPANHYEEEIVYWVKTGVSDTISMETIYQQLPQAAYYYQRSFMLAASTVAIPIPPDAETLSATETPSTLLWEAGGEKAFIFPPDIFIADALSANQWQRPLCFSNTVAAPVLQPWQQHLAREGLIYRLYPETFSGSAMDFSTSAINLDYSLDFWYNRMEFDTTTILTSIDQLSFYSSNLLTGLTLATRLDQLDQSAAAVQFCQFLIEKYPNPIKAWDDSWISILQVLIKAEGDVLAKKLYDTLMVNLDDGLIHQDDDHRRAALSVQLQQIGLEQGLE